MYRYIHSGIILNNQTLTDEWEHKMHGYIYTFSGILFSHKRDDILTHATMWMNLENIMLSEISQTQKNNMI